MICKVFEENVSVPIQNIDNKLPFRTSNKKNLVKFLLKLSLEFKLCYKLKRHNK